MEVGILESWWFAEAGDCINNNVDGGKLCGPITASSSVHVEEIIGPGFSIIIMF